MIHFCFYVPVTHLEKVKSAVFAAGGGRIGNYDSCAFEIRGLGQFRGLDSSQPFFGQKGKVEQVEEVKVEMVCENHLIKEVVAALKFSHPYETPAYYAIEMLGY